MKYCKKCNVNVNHQHNNCPLCGSYLNPQDDNDNCTAYAPMDDNINKPIITHQTKESFFHNKLYLLLLALCALTVVLNLLFGDGTPWSAYVVIGTVALLFCVIFPIAERSKLHHQICTDVAIVTLCAIAMELTVNRLDFMWESVDTVLPWIYVGAIVLVDMLIMFREYSDRGLFSTLILITLFATMPQITLWIRQAINNTIPNQSHLMIIFLASVLNLIIVLIVCTKAIKEEMQRRFNI